MIFDGGELNPKVIPRSCRINDTGPQKGGSHVFEAKHIDRRNLIR
ncbi:hypothetical protein SBDP2_2100001 [Syntrophobacter sp. SbD2]|nr:hypothetical protein SBDP2_2100001 [Syntrophobacter sp. SbD2]